MTSGDMQHESEMQLSDIESESEMSDFLTDSESETTDNSDEGDFSNSDDDESDLTDNDDFDDGEHCNTLTDEDLENFRYSRLFDSKGQASERQRRLLRRNQLTNSNVEDAPGDDSPVNSIQNTTE